MNETQIPKPTEALLRIIDAYGADKDRWPSEGQSLYEALSDDPVIIERLQEAAALDALLAPSPDELPSDALKQNILADFDDLSRRARNELSIFDRIFEAMFGTRFAPAAALAGIGAMGIAVGFSLNAMAPVTSPEEEAYAYFYGADWAQTDEEGMEWIVN